MMTDNKTTKKLGFSLVEALVSMLVLSVFFIASSRVITQKQKTEIQVTPHGYYECYIIGGAQWQHMAIANRQSDAVSTSNCVFEPPTGVNFVNVHYFDGTQYYNYQQSILNEHIEIGQPSGVHRIDVFRDTLIKRCSELEPGDDPIGCIEDPTPSEIAEQVWQFRTYLRLSHPTSNLYRQWVQQGIQPSSAAVLAW